MLISLLARGGVIWENNLYENFEIDLEKMAGAWEIHWRDDCFFVAFCAVSFSACAVWNCYECFGS